MIDRRILLATLTSFAGIQSLNAQNATALKRLTFNNRTLDYFIRYAPDAGTKKPFLLGFGGGDANRGIVEYYDNIYTPRQHYRDHHVILPVGPPQQLYHQFSDSDIRAMMRALYQDEPISGRGIVSGVSNGGRAAFRFAQAAPEAFRGILTMPGAMVNATVPAAWRDYAILLAVGSEDPRWITETNRAFTLLDGKVGALQRAILDGEGHVVGPDYDIDPVYARLRALEAGLQR